MELAYFLVHFLISLFAQKEQIPATKVFDAATVTVSALAPTPSPSPVSSFGLETMAPVVSIVYEDTVPSGAIVPWSLVLCLLALVLLLSLSLGAFMYLKTVHDGLVNDRKELQNQLDLIRQEHSSFSASINPRLSQLFPQMEMTTTVIPDNSGVVKQVLEPLSPPTAPVSAIPVYIVNAATQTSADTTEEATQTVGVGVVDEDTDNVQVVEEQEGKPVDSNDEAAPNTTSAPVNDGENPTSSATPAPTYKKTKRGCRDGRGKQRKKQVGGGGGGAAAAAAGSVGSVCSSSRAA